MILLRSVPPPADRWTEYVQRQYDVPLERGCAVDIQDFQLPGDSEWQIGCIVGPSGSGKTSLLRSMGYRDPEPASGALALISNFAPLDPEGAARLLCGVGLGSVPAWLRPYPALSTGERARADIALSFARTSGLVLTDEFTSTVNREVARAMSVSIAKYVRRERRRLVVASCHKDIVPWLCADWTFDTGDFSFERGRWLRRPKVELSIVRGRYADWRRFSPHHYLTAELNRAARIYLAELAGESVGICALLAQPSAHVRNGWRCSRLVVLPDYQGLGIGRALNDYVGGFLSAAGKRYFFKTVNPAIGEYLSTSPLWRPSAKNGLVRNDLRTNAGGRDTRGYTPLARASYCFEYCGPIRNGSPFVADFLPRYSALSQQECLL